MRIINIVLLFILEKTVIIHNGTLLSKFNSLFVLAFIVSPLGLIDTVRGWFVANSDYVYFVALAVVIDFILGVIVHAGYKRDFSAKKGIIGLTVKFGLVFAVGTLMEGFQAILDSDGIVVNSITVIFRIMVFLYPTLSALYNAAIITKGKFPPMSLLIKMERFNKNLDLSEFKEKPNNEDEL